MRLKSRVVDLIAACGLLVTYSIGFSKDLAIGHKNYRDPQGRFEARIPDSWTVEEFGKGEVLLRTQRIISEEGVVNCTFTRVKHLKPIVEDQDWIDVNINRVAFSGKSLEDVLRPLKQAGASIEDYVSFSSHIGDKPARAIFYIASSSSDSAQSGIYGQSIYVVHTQRESDFGITCTGWGLKKSVSETLFSEFADYFDYIFKYVVIKP